MRTVHAQMVAAVSARLALIARMEPALKAYKRGSVRVETGVTPADGGEGAYSSEAGAPCVRVYLHGQLIARVSERSLGFTLADWPTPTTRAYINTLLRAFGQGAGVWQSKGRQMLAQPAYGVRDGAAREIGGIGWFCEPRESAK